MDHPDAKSIAAYLDGCLTDPSRARIAEHLRECEDCHALFAESSLARAVFSPLRPKYVARFAKPVVLWLAAGALATAALLWLALGSGFPRGGPSAAPAELQALVDAVGTNRSIEPRLTGGFAYGPVQPALRSAATGTPDLRLAEAHAEQAFAAGRSADNMRTLGVAYLVSGQIDRSVAVLEKAAQQTPGDARTASDLAAAYLVRGRNPGRREELAKAAARAEQASRADGSLREAFFNRALAFEALSLRRDARETWAKYLQLDNRSRWADEARQHLFNLADRPDTAWTDGSALLRDPVRCRDRAAVAAAEEAFPLRAREFFEDELLPSWGDALVQSSPAHASEQLECATVVAAAFAGIGDELQRDAVDAIRTAIGRGTSGAALTLAKAHQAYRDGRRLQMESRFQDAERAFRDATVGMRRAGSPFWMQAAFHEANSAFFQHRSREVAADLTALVGAASSHRYSSLLGLVHRLRGVIEVSESKLAAALEDYYAAASQFDRIQDSENAAGVHNLLAETLNTLGEPRDSWEHLARALSLLPTVGSPLQRYQILWMAIQQCMHDDMPDVALHFQNAFLDNANAWPNGAAMGATTSGYLQRSRVMLRLGDLDAADRDVTEARRVVTQVRDRNLAERWNTEILLTDGEVRQRSAPRAAIDVLSGAIAKLQAGGSVLKLPNLFLIRGRAYLAVGDEGNAQADFDRGIDAFEEQHRSVAQARFRTSHFDESWDLFTEMIRLQLRRKQPDVALSYVERGRARTLLEAVAPAARERTLQSQPDMPGRVALLSFVTFSEGLAAWTITNRSKEVVQQAVQLRQIEAKIEALKAALVDGDTHEQTNLLTELYDVLIRPFVAHIDRDVPLVIVPDGPLQSVPFGALIDRETGRYLIEIARSGSRPASRCLPS